MRISTIITALILGISSTWGFTAAPKARKLAFSLDVSSNHHDGMASRTTTPSMTDGIKTALVTASLTTFPLIASAAADVPDDYEYGAVNAPIGLAWGAGVLAILTAAVPVFLQSGEEAFEEMRERDEGEWGTGSADPTKRRR